MADLSVTAANCVPGAGVVPEFGTAGETIAAGKAIYLAASTNKWMLADANSGTAEARDAKAIALTSSSLNQPIAYQRSGSLTLGATMTAGTVYYLSDTPGGICPVADVGSGEYVEVIGVATSTTVMSLILAYSGVAL
jgi:hypothetical protein